jgi:AcrR family transcriptional regulator
MAPADRRAALIAATVPLLQEHGMDVSTKAIAQAAGVAEGTIFGVFPDKGSLLRAALLQALDPQSMLDALAAIDPDAGLRARLTAAADALIRRFTEQSHLMSAARGLVMSADAGPEWYERMMASRERTLAAVTAVIEPDRDRLRRSPATVARLLVLLVGGSSHGMFGATERLTGAEMVDVLLDGLAVRPPDDRTDDPIDDRGGPVPC